jgi:uncharacterized membrane protein YphA (DoxX/SURF4 family)
LGGVILHVDYVTDPTASPSPVDFLVDALARPETIVLLIAGAVMTAGAVIAWAWWSPLEAARLRFIARATAYRDYVPWMIRLSVGLVLIGAGLSRSLFHPMIDAAAPIGFLLIACGYLLLLGLAVRAAALVALTAYAASLVAHPELVMMLDVAGGLAVAAIIGPGQPSLDDLLRAAFPAAPGARAATRNVAAGRYDDVVPLLVRLGLGGAFLASGVVDKIVIYDQALAAVEQYGLTALVPVPADAWVVGAAIVESMLGLAILAGFMTRFSAVVGFAVLSLAMFALPDDPVIAHVALFGLSSVLVVLGAGRWSVDAVVLEPLARRSFTLSG